MWPSTSDFHPHLLDINFFIALLTFKNLSNTLKFDYLMNIITPFEEYTNHKLINTNVILYN